MSSVAKWSSGSGRFVITIYIYLFFNFFIIIIICMNFFKYFVLECFIMPNRIFCICLLFNEYSYLQPVLHFTLAYMGFVPENKLIRIRIRIRSRIRC